MINSAEFAAFAARQLVRNAYKAVLCTNMHPGKDAQGWPLGSLVTIASAWDGSPILMLSNLSQHTQNITRDERSSLVIDGTEGFLNPQEGPRVGIIGRTRPIKDKRFRRRFLSRHPGAALYASFGDFQCYKMEIEKYHYVGGFAQALWIEKQKAVLPRKDWVNIAEAEEDILEHMNLAHPEALRLYGTKLLGKRGKYWNMFALDPEGFDLRCGNSVHRVNFPSLVKNENDCRKALIQMVAKARKG